MKLVTRFLQLMLLLLTTEGAYAQVVSIQGPNGEWPKPTAINDAGQIIGNYGENFDASPLTAVGFLRDTAGGFTSITVPTWPATFPQTINELGQMAGVVLNTAAGTKVGFIRQPNGATATFFPPLSGLNIQVVGINEAGRIVGSVYDNTLSKDRGFIRETNGTFTLFDIANNGWISVSGINDAGVVAGYFYSNVAPFGTRGFIRAANGTITVFDGPNGPSDDLSVYGPNTAGQLLLSYENSNLHKIREANGSFTSIAPPTGDWSGFFLGAINDSGQLGGIVADRFGFVYGLRREANGAYRVFRLDADDDPDPAAMNNKGWIVGSFYDLSKHKKSGFLWKAPPIDDLLIDFGAGTGLWAYKNSSTWALINGASPTVTASGDTDGNGQDEVLISLPPYGLWSWKNNSTWVQLHPLSPLKINTGDLDGNGQDDVIVDFGPGIGVYAWMNDSSWSFININSPEFIATGDLDGNGKTDLLIDFGPAIGLYVWMNNTNWTQLHNLSPVSIATGDINGTGKDDAIINFGPAVGLWIWFDNSFWVYVPVPAPLSMAVGDLDADRQDDVVLDLGPSRGVWIWMNNSNWVPLPVISPKSMVTADMDGDGLSEVVFDFGPGYGIWVLKNSISFVDWILQRNATWTPLHSTSPDSIAVGDIDGP